MRVLAGGIGMLCLGALVFVGGSSLRAADDKGGVAGKVASADGTVLRKDGKVWKAVKTKTTVNGGDILLSLPGMRGDVDSKDGSVQLSLWGNVPEFYNAPVLESEVELAANSERAFDVNVMNGRILLKKGKGKEGSWVRVRYLDRMYDVHLAEPGTEVAVEQYGRWPRGSRFSKRPRPDELPTLALSIFVTKGRADLKIGDEQFLMSMGATFYWNNIGGGDRLPHKVDKLPAWTEEKTLTAEGKQMQATLQKLEKQLAEKPADAVVLENLDAKEAAAREVAVYSLGALNDMPHLVEALAAGKHANVRETAISALRHWIGQGSGQDLRLYRFLVDQKMYSTNQAEIIMQLLHSFEDAARDRPETYETMIEYLRHDNPAIRELARWHLYRWAIAGRDIPYNALGSNAELDKAYKAWKALVPDGTLPPAGKK